MHTIIVIEIKPCVNHKSIVLQGNISVSLIDSSDLFYMPGAKFQGIILSECTEIKDSSNMTMLMMI